MNGWTLLTACMLLAAVATSGRAAEESVTRTQNGTLILRSFKNAPYPHASRAEGFTRGGVTYPAAEHYSDSTVGLFIPKDFHPGKRTDFVFHFHGHVNHVSQVIASYDLEGQMVKSGRNAILVVPQGPKDVPDSGGGHLELDPGGFQALVEEIAAYLAETGRIPSPAIGRIIVGGHSGGYATVSGILQRGGMNDHITDVLLYDSSYGELAGFADWIQGGSGRRLISIFTEHLASANVQLMAMLTQRGVPFRVMLEPDATDDILRRRGALFLHTLDLAHNDVLGKKDTFARWLRTSGLAAVSAD